jgi:peptidoglycan/xylan/chitin deacetylase (PgdA/CDA1 family)
MNKDYLKSILSQTFHYFAFSCKKPKSELDLASLVISIDVDVGSPKVGLINGGRNDHNVHDFRTERDIGEIEEQVIPFLLQAFNDFEFPATFALRGQLFEVENSIVNQILESSTQHEIAAHGYTHRIFTDLSETEADQELKMVSEGMKKFDIKLKSFVFPKNKVSHLRLLEKNGFLSYRDEGNLFRDGLYVRKKGNLLDVHPSLFLSFYSGSFCKNIIDLAVKYRAPLHIWFHPSDVMYWNLGNFHEVANERINDILLPLLEHARKKKKQGLLKFETMASMAEQYQRSEEINEARNLI